MTLIATPKATNANSFATVAEADAYHDTRLHNAEWSAASDADKTKALIQATRILDAMTWKGARTTTTQALKFPRFGLYTDDGIVIDSDTIPEFIVNAVSELAWLLIIGDTTRESGTKGFKSIGVGPISLSVDKTDRTDDIPVSVTKMIKQWLYSSGSLKVVRG